jgi:hypothetical protein
MAIAPAPALAHDAFGDLGPFYASMLHPVADLVQAVLIIGTGAILARRPLEWVRIALPVFILAAALAYIFLGWLFGLAASAFLSVGFVLVAGCAALLPASYVPNWAGVALVAAIGGLVGLAPDRPPASGEALQPVLGTLLGISVAIVLAWAALDVASRRLSWIVPAVAGSWVTAIGMLAIASNIAGL